MKIYHYDPLTRLFLFEDVAEPDPLVPDNFLIPAWSTGLPPLTKIPKGQQTFFDGDTWALRDIPQIAQPEESNPLTDEELMFVCTQTAKQKLNESAWSQAADVITSLKNPEDFTKYRAALMQLLSKPDTQPVWPVEPVPVWKS